MSCVYRRQGTVDETRVGRRTVLYQTEQRRALVLNPAGSALWPQTAEGADLEQLTRALMQRYPSLTEQQASDDTRAFLKQMVAQGLLAAIG